MITGQSSREEVQAKLVEILVEMFELEASEISSDSELYDELDIDSIDAVDLIVRLKELTGKKVEPEQFKDIRTVADVVNTIQALLKE